MTLVSTPLIGRFGNQCFAYAFARARAEQLGVPLSTPPWIGEQIFQLPEVTRDAPLESCLNGYFQDQASLIYTRAQVKEWFKFRPEIEHALSFLPRDPLLAHRRVGDYAGAGYVVVSTASYLEACEEFGLDQNQLKFVTEEAPTNGVQVPPELAFLPDFYRMIKCHTLLRGNSTFSYWAAVLGDCRVFSPIIEGLKGGCEQDVKFTSGNWPRFANLEFVTNLHLQ